MKKVIIFDLDGTILDTLADLKNSVNFVLENLGLEAKTIEEVRTYVGNGIEVLMRRALLDEIEEEEFQRAFAMFKTHYEANIQNETRPYPEIIELMIDLINHGVLLTVVSNKFQAGVDRLVHDFFEDLINVAVGTSESIRPKPEIDSIEYLFNILNIKTEDEVYFVGDSEVDIQTARNANIPIISVGWGFRNREDLEDYEPDFIVDEPRDILNIVINKE